MNQQEFAQALDSENRSDTSKFVYFLFSITTVSIGYSITATREVIFSWWLIIWFISTIAMSISLVYGSLYLSCKSKALDHISLTLSLSHNLQWLGIVNDSELKEKIKSSFLEISKLNPATIEPTTLQQRFELFLFKKLATASNNNQKISEYIDELSPQNLRKSIHDSCFQFISGEKSELDTIEKALGAINNSVKYLTKQRQLLIAGFIFFIIWHCITLFSNKPPPENENSVKAHNYYFQASGTTVSQEPPP